MRFKILISVKQKNGTCWPIAEPDFALFHVSRVKTNYIFATVFMCQDLK